MRSSRDETASADARIRAIGAQYPVHKVRDSTSAPEGLAEDLGIERPIRGVAVVGTNGKTSTATFLARALQAAGRRVGLTTSPHIERWGERVRVDGIPVDDVRFADRLEELHSRVRSRSDRDSFRFFDLLTLAAATIFEEEDVDLAVYEAGIGGRLDSTHALQPPLVVLTGIGLDHVEVLGRSEEAILREKLGVASAGAVVLSAALRDDLIEHAEHFAAESRVELRFQELASGSFLLRNATLARAAAAVLVNEAELPDVGVLALAVVPGRLERRRVLGIDVLLDAAHNPQAWQELPPVLPPSFVAVVSASADRPVDALRETLGRATRVVVTEAWPGRSYPAADLARRLGAADVIQDPVLAVRRAAILAAETSEPLVVVGSTYLLPHAYRALQSLS